MSTNLFKYDTILNFKQGSCFFNPANVAATVIGYGNVSATEDALKLAVATIGPISVGTYFKMI
jgi:hypothetical protein